MSAFASLARKDVVVARRLNFDLPMGTADSAADSATSAATLNSAMRPPTSLAPSQRENSQQTRSSQQFARG